MHQIGIFSVKKMNEEKVRISPSDRELLRKLLILNEYSLLKKFRYLRPALDFIHSEDLEAYYDSFLIPDTNHLDGKNYKVRLRFSPSIVDPKINDELGVISRIVERRRLNPILLEHPLVCVFLALKWHAMKNYFWTALFLQAFLLLITGYFLHVSSSNVFQTTVEFFLFIFNAVIKFMIFFNSQNSVFAFSNRASVHGLMELLVVLTQALAFFNRQFRVFVFTEMTVCFFLTAGYYYENTKFGFFLEKIFKVASFLLTISMIFYLFFLLLDYHIEEYIFKYFATTAFKIYNMTAEVDTEDIKFDKIGEFNNAYALLPIFLPKTISFIMKLWSEKSGKDDDDEEIDEETEIDALKNTLSFMKFVERLYKRNPLNLIHKYFRNPFLFPFLDDDGCYDRNKTCEVILYVNRKNKQFGNNVNYPSKLDKECTEKIKMYCKEAEKNVLKQHLQDIQSKLETLEKLLEDKVIPTLN